MRPYSFLAGLLVGSVASGAIVHATTSPHGEAIDSRVEQVNYAELDEAQSAAAIFLSSESWPHALNVFTIVGPGLRAPIDSDHKHLMLEVLEYHDAYRKLLPVLALSAFSDPDLEVRAHAMDLLEGFETGPLKNSRDIIGNAARHETNAALRTRMETYSGQTLDESQ